MRLRLKQFKWNAYKWLLRQGYTRESIKFNVKVPTFTTSDGRGWEVRRPFGYTIIFLDEDLEALRKQDNTVVLVFGDNDSEPRTIIPASELDDGRVVNGYRVVVIPKFDYAPPLIPINTLLWNLFVEYVYRKHGSTKYIVKELEKMIREKILHENMEKKKTNKIPVAKPELLS